MEFRAGCESIPGLVTVAGTVGNWAELSLVPIGWHSFAGLRDSAPDGWDPLFVQQQAGHDHPSTTLTYACVSSGFRLRTLRQALDATMGAARGRTTAGRAAP